MKVPKSHKFDYIKSKNFSVSTYMYVCLDTHINTPQASKVKRQLGEIFAILKTKKILSFFITHSNKSIKNKKLNIKMENEKTL